MCVSVCVASVVCLCVCVILSACLSERTPKIEMAALVAGVQYGLSSHSNFHENKSLIFVKLTDSAQRAIEDYLKNRNKTSQSPTIQFLGNEGQLSFPSSQSNHGSTGFTFSLSSNHDIEGPQGGFECVQQTGPKSLESLGTLPCKMRIQANDDVYETTRHRMAVAEENSKNKCTRVIKANGPDIGRKIKVKATGRTIPPPPPTTTSSSSLLSSSSSSSLSSLSSTNVRHRESLSIPTNVSQSSRLNYNLNTSSTMSSSTITPSLSSSLSNSSHKSMGTNNNPPLRMQQSKKLSELMRRPLKERLIHVLALRPYKKPELYDRITREGIKERDRSTMTTILKQVAYMHDNTYHLHLYIWNDIQEDWPFYSEQDRAMLKRRKPQNLTPPGSSDGSSGSGQSPNSMHPGSPPAIIAPPPSLINSKRPGYYQGNDGLQTKRPRISHYRKPEPTTRTSAGSSNSNSTNNNNTNINSGHGLSGNMSTSSMITSNETANWEHQQQSRQHQRDRSDYRIEKIERTERTANSDVLRGSYTTIAKPCLTPTSDCDENVVNNNNNNNNNNNKNNGNRYGNISSSSSSSSAAAAAAAAAASSSSSLSSTTTVSSCYNSTSINSNNNLYNSGIPSTTTTRYNSNVPNGNDKVSSVVNSGNCVGAGVFDYMRSFGGNINKNINNNSVSVGGGGGSSSSINNGGNNRGFGASPCNSGVIEARRGIGDFRDGRNNDKERGGDREKRELINKNIGSATGGINSYKINDSSANYGVCNNYIDSNENNSSSVAATVPTTPTTATATTTTTITGSSIIPTPVSPTVTSSNAKTSEYPDYLTQYTAINNTEQRRRYKAEFNSYYEEYRRLHTEVAKVSKRFAHLEELRQRELEIGNSAKGLELRAQIVAEYMSTKNDPAHIETKKCFHYLHEKLSHIKRLVLEYDTQHYGVTTSDDMSNNCNDILSGSGDLRY